MPSNNDAHNFNYHTKVIDIYVPIKLFSVPP